MEEPLGLWKLLVQACGLQVGNQGPGREVLCQGQMLGGACWRKPGSRGYVGSGVCFPVL